MFSKKKKSSSTNSFNASTKKIHTAKDVSYSHSNTVFREHKISFAEQVQIIDFTSTTVFREHKISFAEQVQIIDFTSTIS
jgi:hypothetical protein